MRYKAVLTGVSGLERPKQMFGDSLSIVLDWAANCQAAYADRGGLVELYELQEVPIDLAWWNARNASRTVSGKTKVG